MAADAGVLMLGPLAVISASSSQLGGARQRAVLASLLVSRGKVVSADQLLEDVYGANPPATASKSLQAHISRLRSVLGRGRPLTWQGGGYVLTLADGEVDADVFVRLVDEGRAALAGGDPARAAARLRTASSLWRGPALSDVAYADFAQGEIARLEELRLNALEDLAEARLALGEHADLMAVLEQLVAAYPLRERLRWLQLLGFYRCGRQADALAAYQAARSALVDQLGIEPGRALKDLHQAILNQDATLDLRVDPLSEAERVAAVRVVSRAPAESSVSESRKTVTAMFARLSCSSATGSPLDPEALRRVTGRAFDAVRSTTNRHGGAVESVTGDSITVVFSLPVVNEDDAWRAVRASAETRTALLELAGLLEDEEGPILAFGIGVSTGQVVAGASAELAFGAIGEPLTRSASLGFSAASGEILLDEPTQKLVRYSVTCEPAAGAWRLVRVGDGISTHAGRLTSSMVGRDRERRQLLDVFEQVVGHSSCHLFTVLGTAGVGKSRLLQEFLGDLAGRALIVRGRCLPYGEGITYWPLLEAVSDAIGLKNTDTPEFAAARITETLGDRPEGMDVAQALTETIGLSERASGAEAGFAAAATFFQALAREKPLVLVFDDIHWGEATFLDLVERLAESTRDAPILLVCLARLELLELRPGWGGGKRNATTTELEPLSGLECGRLLENLAGSTRLDGGFKAKIAGAAEGNPLFVEEMLSMLIDDGLVVRANDQWVPTGELDEVRAPPTIQALLAARLDRLSKLERAVIECAAVGGKVFFPEAILALVAGASAQETEETLASLVRKDLICPQTAGRGRPTYRFRHLLIRDAAYESIPKQLRADLHEQFGRWLARSTGERATEYEEVVGYHLEQAYRYIVELGHVTDAATVIAREAAERLGAAGHRALDRSDAPAGLNLISRATSLLPPEDPLRVDLVPSMRVVQGIADLAWVERLLTDAVEAAATSGNRLLAANALVQRGFLRLFTETTVTPEELHDTAQRAISVFEDLNDHVGLARAWRLVAQANYLGLSLAGCEEASERALAHVRLSGNPFEEREIVEWLVIALLLGPTAAGTAAERCLDLLRAAEDNPTLQAEILGGLAMLSTMCGREADADEYQSHAHAIMNRTGQSIWIVRFWLSFVHLARRDPEKAEAELRPGYEALKRFGETSHFSSLAHALATTVYMLGRYDEAERLTRECEDACRPNDIHSGIMWRSIRAKIHARRGQHELADQLSRHATELGARSDFVVAHADASLDRADVLALAGDNVGAADAAEQAVRLYEVKGNTTQAEYARAQTPTVG